MEELKVGDVIKERYSLVRFLGSGSFGEVWLAHDQLTGRDVALKIYLSLDPAGVEEFQREYANTAGLSSPYLLTPEYFDVYGRRPFLVMRYCENGSSSKLAGNITEEQLWQFVLDVAEGLTVLHGQSDPMVHQDIKPDNILVDGTGRFMITDFGISRRLRATMRRQSKRDVSSGAMPYMAPERFESNPRLSTASDIWSLGASIYELATGELPFNGFGGAMQRQGADMPSLSQNYSPVLNEIMQRCLNPDLGNRPSANEISCWARTKTIPNALSANSRNTVAKQPTAIQETKSTGKSVKSSSNLPATIIMIIALILLSAVLIYYGVSALSIVYNTDSRNSERDNSQSVQIDSLDYDPLEEIVVSEEVLPSDIGDGSIEGSNASSKQDGNLGNGEADDEIFVAVEQIAEFPGGNEALMKWLSENVKYPEDAYQNDIQGRVVVKFIIRKDGTVEDAVIQKGVCKSLDMEALRVVRSMPKWIPGKNNGVNVSSWFNIPITFSLKNAE